jgi:hypothetical protein
LRELERGWLIKGKEGEEGGKQTLLGQQERRQGKKVE